MRTVEERLMAKVEPVTESGCWLWTGTTNKDGYGMIRTSVTQTESTHRASFKLFKGDIPDGLCVCHRCDVPSCVNPQHLFLGTRKDNMQDAISKGRFDGGSHYADRTHCKNGHEYTQENIYRPNSAPNARSCRKCAAEKQRKYRAYRREKKSWPS